MTLRLTPAQLNAGTWVACPRCGGSPEQDEDGRFFTCFFCCDHGSVPESWANEEHAVASWHAFVTREREILDGTYGKVRCWFCGPECYDHCPVCADTGWILPTPRPPRQPAPAPLFDDDIPF